jgi:glycosyltransferase involved in cell wall biosynthesis
MRGGPICKDLRLMVADFVQASDRTERLAERNGAAAIRSGMYRPISSQLALSARVTVLIPAKNEAENLPHVFATLPAWIDELVLVDGRSTDDTVAVAQRLRPDIKVVRQVGSGKGDALLAGFAASTGDIIVTMDADGSTDGREIVHFVAALAAGADFVKGSRFANGGGSADLTATRRFGNRILGALVNLLFGTNYTDLCYGYNAFWACHLESLGLDCDGFEVETLMNIRAAEAGLRVHEVPSFEHRRLHGVSNLDIVLDGRRIARVIILEWRRRLLAQRALARRNAAREISSPPSSERLREAVPAQATEKA